MDYRKSLTRGDTKQETSDKAGRVIIVIDDKIQNLFTHNREPPRRVLNPVPVDVYVAAFVRQMQQDDASAQAERGNFPDLHAGEAREPPGDGAQDQTARGRGFAYFIYNSFNETLLVPMVPPFVRVGQNVRNVVAVTLAVSRHCIFAVNTYKIYNFIIN